LLVLIKSIHAEVKQEYGAPVIHKVLKDRGVAVGKKRVKKLMQAHGIRSKTKRRFKVTTDSKHNLPIAPNIVDRNFTATAPDQVWTIDIFFSFAIVGGAAATGGSGSIATGSEAFFGSSGFCL
jgi:putative transposase